MKIYGTAQDNQRDLDKVSMRMEMFAAPVKGYVNSAGDFLNATERAHLVLSGKLITLENGIRFLTDYLEGDVYFKTHREDHNLDRCRTQCRLIESMEQQEDSMHTVVEKVLELCVS